MENNFNLTKQMIKAALKKAEEKAAKEGKEIIVIKPERNFAKEFLETLDLDLSKRDDLPIFYGETIGAAVKKTLGNKPVPSFAAFTNVYISYRRDIKGDNITEQELEHLTQRSYALWIKLTGEKNA